MNGYGMNQQNQTHFQSLVDVGWNYLFILKLFYSQLSTAVFLKFENGEVISGHTI